MKNKEFTIKELLLTINELDNDSNFKKKNNKFSKEEVKFIIDIIFNKKSKSLFFYLSDYIISNSDITYFSSSVIKRIRYLYKFLRTSKGRQSAIDVGYSIKGASNQAYRIRKELSGYKRKVIDINGVKKEKWIKVE